MSTYMLLSLILGAISAVPALIVCLLLGVENPFAWTLLVSSAFALLLYPVLRVMAHRTDKKYAQFESGIKVPVFHQMNGNIRLGDYLRNGNLYFFENGIIMASLDEKPNLVEELPLSTIEHFTFEDVHMTIRLSDGRVFRITSTEVEATRAALKERDWVF